MFSTGRDLHIDGFLSEMAINFRPQGFIADMIAPIIPVLKESDVYPVFKQEEMFAVENDLRARGQEANKITVSVSSATYVCKNYALARDLYIEDIANMDASLQFEMGLGATHHIIDRLRMGWERRIGNAINSASNVATTFVPASAWTATGGDPISQIMQMIEQGQGSTGYKPNSILFGWRAWALFRRNQQVRNFILGTNNGGSTVTRQAAQSLFEVDRFLVQEVFTNSANEAQPLALGQALHDRVFVYYAPLRPSREEPSWMYSFRWQAPGLPAPLVVERHPYDSRKKIETIEAGYYQDEKVTGTAFGATLIGVGSSQASGLA